MQKPEEPSFLFLALIDPNLRHVGHGVWHLIKNAAKPQGILPIDQQIRISLVNNGKKQYPTPFGGALR
ncbi:MAG: hypothetical protein HQL95_08140 [Magnetococcales bacterium]|nr:hypothetical protein [Magnetococcales bacterium]